MSAAPDKLAFAHAVEESQVGFAHTEEEQSLLGVSYL